MNPLQAQLQQIVAEFVSGVLDATRHMSLSDLTGQPRRAAATSRSTPTRNLRGKAKEPRTKAQPAPNERSGNRHRSTAEEILRYKDLALTTARQMPPGFSKGDLMKRTGGKVDMGRFLALLVDEGLLTRKGDRRGARYWVN